MSISVPWEAVEASLRIPQRWADPHLLRRGIPESRRRAAVAVLLWGGPEGARQVVLIRRGADAPRHGGEMAFPGGMVEPWDRDLPATARRELEEELGVSDHLWEMGCFPDGVARSHTRFTPVFLRWEAPEPLFRPNREVQDVVPLSLPWLLEAPWGTQRVELEGGTVTIPRLELPLAPLWGATALVLKTWLEVLRAAMRNPGAADILGQSAFPQFSPTLQP